MDCELRLAFEGPILRLGIDRLNLVIVLGKCLKALSCDLALILSCTSMRFAFKMW